jgi:hypothetical protein
LYDNYGDLLYKSGFKGTISNPEVKMGSSLICAYNIEGKRIGLFVMSNMINLVATNYMYADRNVTIKGYIETIIVIDDDNDFSVKTEYDYSLKKGWNIIYPISQIHDGEVISVLFTTKKPSDADLKWYFVDVLFLNGYEKQKTYDWQNPFFKIR